MLNTWTTGKQQRSLNRARRKRSRGCKPPFWRCSASSQLLHLFPAAPPSLPAGFDAVAGSPWAGPEGGSPSLAFPLLPHHSLWRKMGSFCVTVTYNGWQLCAGWKCAGRQQNYHNDFYRCWLPARSPPSCFYFSDYRNHQGQIRRSPPWPPGRLSPPGQRRPRRSWLEKRPEKSMFEDSMQSNLTGALTDHGQVVLCGRKDVLQDQQ